MWNKYSNIPISALLRYQAKNTISGSIYYLPRRRPSPAALATAQALQLLQPLGPLLAWTLSVSLYTIVAVLTPFPAALHARLQEMWSLSSTARRVAKKAVPMRNVLDISTQAYSAHQKQ